MVPEPHNPDGSHSEHSVAVSDCGRYVVVKIVGEGPSHRALEAAYEAHALGRSRGIRHFLCDYSEFRNIGSVGENYAAAYRGAREAPEIDRFARVAVLSSSDDRSHDFAEIVARNSGQDLKLFTDRDEAIRFLTEE